MDVTLLRDLLASPPGQVPLSAAAGTNKYLSSTAKIDMLSDPFIKNTFRI